MIFIPRKQRRFLPHLVVTIQTANHLLPGFVEEHGLWRGLWQSLRLGWLLTGPREPKPGKVMTLFRNLFKK